MKGRIFSWERTERVESRAAGSGLGCAVCSTPLAPCPLVLQWSSVQLFISVRQNGLLLEEESLFHSRPQEGRGNSAAGSRDLENFTL